MASVLEWALQLRMLKDVEGSADVRTELRGDTSAWRTLHTELQLGVAAHGMRLGWPVRLEPAGAAAPAALSFGAPEGALVVEVRVLTELETSRLARIEIDRFMDRVTTCAAAHGRWLSGKFERLPTEGEILSIERWIADGEDEPALEGIALRLAQRDAAEGVLTSPRISDDLWPRRSA